MVPEPIRYLKRSLWDTGRPSRVTSLALVQGALQVSTNPFPHARGNKMEIEDNNIIKQEKDSERSDLSENISLAVDRTDLVEETIVDKNEAETNESAKKQDDSGSSLAESLPKPAEIVTPNPKRLSRAQMRKIKRAEKMAAGLWTKEKPIPKRQNLEWDTSRESVSFKRPYLKPTHPHSSVPKHKHGKEWSLEPEHPRRPPVSFTWLSYDRDVISNIPSGSYSENDKGMTMAVIHRRHPDDILEKEQSDLVQNQLVAALDNIPSGSDTPPQFEGTLYKEGVLWVSCANFFTKTWLQQTVSSLEQLWQGADLTVVEAKDLPKRSKLQVWIPNVVEENVIRTRLEIQNPGLKTGDWRVLDRTIEDEGQTIRFSVDAASYKVLEGARFKAYCGLWKTIGHVEILTPHTDLSEIPTRITREDLMPRMTVPAKMPDPVPEMPSTPSPRPLLPKPALSAPTGGSGMAQKKGRGRPRKYPPVPRPLIKRPRGRPRLNPSAPVPRPGTNFETQTPQSTRSTENYDITNMPFGDLEYLTKPELNIKESPEHFEDSNSNVDPNLMEPLVEIQLDQNDQSERQEQMIHHTAGSFLQNIGLLETSAIANIGECTISLTNSPST